MDTLLKDLRYAMRGLLRRPGFTAIAVITLALAIGANTAIFSVVQGVLLEPLPYPESDRLVALRQSNLQANPAQPDTQVAPGNFLEWQRQQSSTFSGLVAYRTVSYNLTGDGNPERLLAGRVSSGLFRLLGAQPMLGRDFLAGEDQPGREKVVIVSEGLWRRRFGADANVIGRTLKLDGEDFAIVGVMPAAFRLPDQRERELWTPIAFKDSEKKLYQARYIDAIAKLKPGAWLAQAQAEMNAIAARLAQEHPESNTGWTINVMPLLDFVVGDVKVVLWVLFAAVALVLLIACANVTNLLLARATTRQKEMAVRAALGAGRGRIVRQLATESLLLSFVGAFAAWPLASWGLRVLLAAAPADLPRLTSVTIDKRALLFTLGITLVTAFIFGLAPALHVLKFDTNPALRDQRNRSVRQQRIGNLLIASEVALALMLLVCGGLLLRTVWQLNRVNPGFDERNALAVTVQLPEKKYAGPQQVARFAEQLVQQVSTLPGVEAAGVARILPIVHDLPTGLYFEGGPRAKDSDLPQTNYSAVSPDYFKAMGIPLIAGRAFTEHDTLDAPRVAIVSQTLAQRFFPNGDALGKRINVNMGPESYREIVGIAGDVKQNGLTRETRPHTYEPFAQAPNQFMTLIVRSTTDPAALVPAIRGKVLALDSELPLQRVTTLDRVISNSIRQQRFTSLVLSVFAGVALLLAAAGLYGVISYSVAQRTHELGIRVALGAQVNDVMGLVLRQGMTIVVAGELIGILGALALTRLLGGLLFGVTPADAATFVAVTIGLTLVALLACYIPARRATKVDPLVALRYE